MNRFRSKEDLYRYLTQQGKLLYSALIDNIVGIFLPSQDGCKLIFLRAILSDEKKAIKNSELKTVDVPNYAELSVKNMYEDAMRDPLVSQYLPDKNMNSGKLPERLFFFGVLATIKNQYLTQVIHDSQSKRYKADEGYRKNQSILLTDTWLEEHRKYPYFSSKL